MSWEVIIPFLRPIEALIRDPEISDILVNGGGRVFVERHGYMTERTDLAIAETTLQVAVRNIARVLGDDISEEKPILDARLPDGSRVAAVFPPVSVSGTILAIRKFHGGIYTAEELVRIGSITAAALTILRKAVEDRKNILISGGAGAGKTTLLNALARFIPAEERVVVIEDTAELYIESPNLVRLEARHEQGGVVAVTMRDLLKATLRLRPDRVLLGEVRGGEAFDLLQAMNTGHGGCLSTVHADSAAKALARLTTCVLMSGIDLPYKALRGQIADGLHITIHVSHFKGRRIVTEVRAVHGYDPALDAYELETLYEGN